MRKFILVFFSASILLATLGCNETISPLSNAAELSMRSNITNINSADIIEVTQSIDIQSAHPYENLTKQSWTIEAPENALTITAHFDKLVTESNYDFVKIFNSSGELEYELEGYLYDQSFTIEGNRMSIVFSSDSFVRYWGFSISEYTYTIEKDKNNDPGLIPIRSSKELKNYVSEIVTEKLLQRPIQIWKDMPLTISSIEKSKDNTPNDYTTTNVQEEGVDEADIVETDGQHLFVLNDRSLIILKSWPAEETSELSRIELDGYANGMFLDGSRLVVLSSTWNDSLKHSATEVTIIDVTDKSNPKIFYQAHIEGYYIDSRTIDGQLHIITSSSQWSEYNQTLRPLCDEINCHSWDEDPSPEKAREEKRKLLLPKVKAYFEKVPVNELLPIISEKGNIKPALSSTDLRRPWKVMQNGLLMFSSINMHSKNPTLNSSGIIGTGYKVYASLKNLYITQSSQFWFWWRPLDEDDKKTVIHKISISNDGNAPIYQASASVPGWTHNQFSMSERNGLLRIATTEEWRMDENKGSNIFILKQEGRHLKEVGSIRGMSPEQRIFAVRFMEDLAYVVTFEQIDPLHVVDLSNPYAPQQLGELEIPGFSTYLHPFEDGLLMGIGRDEKNFMQLSMFDVKNPKNPIRIHQSTINTHGWSEALHNHHAFTFHPKRKILAIPVNIYRKDQRFSGTIVYEVSKNNGFKEIGRIDHSEISLAARCDLWFTEDKDKCYDQYYWVNMQRNVFIENSIYSISNVGLTVNDLYNPKTNYATLVWNFGPWTFSNNSPQKIPDNDRRGIKSLIEVSGKPDCQKASIFLDLNVTHSYQGDLVISLADPTGNTKYLHRHQGGSKENIVFDKLQLSDLGYEGLNGSWVLNISDEAQIDEGVLDYWTLHMSCGSERID